MHSSVLSTLCAHNKYVERLAGRDFIKQNNKQLIKGTQNNLQWTDGVILAENFVSNGKEK